MGNDQIRITKFLPLLEEVKKVRPDLRVMKDLDALKILLQERMTELMIKKAEKENGAARI